MLQLLLLMHVLLLLDMLLNVLVMLTAKKAKTTDISLMALILALTPNAPLAPRTAGPHQWRAFGVVPQVLDVAARLEDGHA